MVIQQAQELSFAKTEWCLPATSRKLSAAWERRETRVPPATLLDYLEAGQPVSEFLEDFPTVTREQAVAALEQAKPT